MPQRELSIEIIEQQARALIDARMEAVRRLVTARQRVTDLREQVADAEREDARLYSAALTDGWSADELRRLGLGEPDKLVRTKRRATARRNAPASSGADNAGSGEG